MKNKSYHTPLGHERPKWSHELCRDPWTAWSGDLAWKIDIFFVWGLVQKFGMKVAIKGSDKLGTNTLKIGGFEIV